jgi:hypothetical protein
MSTELEVRQASWWRSFWLGAAGAFLMLSFGWVLKRWLPLHFAVGIGGFVGWFIVGLMFARRTPPKYGIPVWVAVLITGLASGLCVGLLSYYFPW